MHAHAGMHVQGIDASWRLAFDASFEAVLRVPTLLFTPPPWMLPGSPTPDSTAALLASPGAPTISRGRDDGSSSAGSRSSATLTSVSTTPSRSNNADEPGSSTRSSGPAASSEAVAGGAPRMRSTSGITAGSTGNTSSAASSSGGSNSVSSEQNLRGGSARALTVSSPGEAMHTQQHAGAVSYQGAGCRHSVLITLESVLLACEWHTSGHPFASDALPHKSC